MKINKGQTGRIERACLQGSLRALHVKRARPVIRCLPLRREMRLLELNPEVMKDYVTLTSDTIPL